MTFLLSGSSSYCNIIRMNKVSIDLLLQGLGTDDRALIRIMVSRSEIDLFNIRKEFKDTHDVSLHEFIQVETMIVSQRLCVLTLLVGLFYSHLCVICLMVFVLLCDIVWVCVAHPSGAVVGWWGTVIYSFLRWTLGLWLLHSCLGISPACLTSSLYPLCDWLRATDTGSTQKQFYNNLKSPWHKRAIGCSGLSLPEILSDHATTSIAIYCVFCRVLSTQSF